MTRGYWGRLSQRGRLLWVTGLLALLALAWLRWWPMGTLFDTPRSTVVLDRTGHLLGAAVALDGQWRFPPGDSVPERFATCLIQFEDRHFHEHHGVHLPSLVRALKQNTTAGRTVSGGSTLTMQVARLSRKGRERTLMQKFIELVLALRIEQRYTKQEVLDLFASNAPFGGNVVGLEAAAWRYYGRAPDQLTWAESATLAVLPNAPSAIYPGHGQQALRAKRDRLLSRLLDIGAIDSLEWSLAVQEPLPESVRRLPQHAPHLLATLRSTGHEGERVHTTIDADLQDRVTAAVARQAPALKGNEVHNAAAMVMDVATGNVLAYVGNLPGTGADHAEAVDIVRARRSTGSLLKPFLYADMLQKGELTPDMLVADLPTRYDGFSPRNYDERYLGAVPASQALARSLNVPAVRALRTHGVDRTIAVLRGMGLTSIDRSAAHYGLSLIVGGAECDLWSLTGAYASMGRVLQEFGSGSTRAPIHAPVVIVTEADAALPATASPLSAGALHFTLKALREVKRPESEGNWQRFVNSEAVSWKTGTSMGHRDAWAIGLTDRVCVGVWTGNADGEGRPGLTGTLAAAPLLFELFSMLPRGNGSDVPYDDLVRMPICARSGHLASPDCDRVDSVWIPRGAERTPICPYHQRVLVDPSERFRVPPGAGGHERSWFILPPGMEHYYMQRDPSYRPLPSWNAAGMADNAVAMEIIYPEPGSRIAIPIDLDGSRGHVVAEAAHRQPGVEIHWSLDGRYIGTTKTDHRSAIDPPEGEHVLLLTDEKGNRTQCRFEVIGEREPSSETP